MTDIASQIFTGDNLFPFEIGAMVDLPTGTQGVVVMGSSMHESKLLGEYYLIRISLCDEAGDFDEDEWEVFTWAYGSFIN